MVADWIEAFNARDLARMLRCVDADVDFHPPRMTSGRPGYRGHGGMEEWLSRLVRHGPDYCFRVDRVSCADGRQVVATGALVLDGDDLSGLWGVHEVSDGLIVSATHYLSDPELIDQLGLIATSPPRRPRT